MSLPANGSCTCRLVIYPDAAASMGAAFPVAEGPKAKMQRPRFGGDMIDDRLGFQLVPWRPALDAHLSQHVAGTMKPGGGVDWTLGRPKGSAL